MVEIVEHSLIFRLFNKAFMIRPCNDRTGKFSFLGSDIPLFRSRRRFQESVWDFFVLPYILFAVISFPTHKHNG